ncbi:MAG: VCBS repeat-containing protein [Phycisphaerales bacterium]|nr:VCBS repeat-containing protein [Phycisphaerales bacterium]
MRRALFLCGSTFLLLAGSMATADWVDFVNETSTRLPVPPNSAALSVNDPEEKDYAWGDVDNDGDIDVVCVRKQPFTTTGKRVNVLFMNEGPAEGQSIQGIFIDRTAQYATASDVPGDQGFNTPTNDRDVVLYDLDNDGWLDMVTAVTLTDNQAKHLSHPRVYMNLGEDGNGNWLGFEYQDARIPQMHATAGPRFCSVAAGDVTGDGHPDLYFGDYDSGGAQIMDYNNRLLVNDGTGSFTDQTGSRLTSQMANSAFGASSVIIDVNDDGVNDVVKQTSLNAPLHVAVTYNNPTNEGVFNLYDVVNTQAPYFVNTGDLNNDGRVDLVLSDDGTDHYLLNTGNGSDGAANFNTLSFPSGPSGGFGGNNICADFNNDGFLDVVITDVDVDISGCNRNMRVYRNLGNLPNVTLSYQSAIGPPGGKDPNGVHDVAIFDINGDGWLDMWVGRCNGTEIWINDPPVGMQFAYPLGLPGMLTPGEASVLEVRLTGIGGNPDPDTAMFHYSISDSPFQAVLMTPIGNDIFEVEIPAGECLDTLSFYVTASLIGGGSFSDPQNAPLATYNSMYADGVEEIFVDDMEGDVSGWSVSSENLTSGEWEVADPNGTVSNGQQIAPADDASQAADAVMAWVTENGPPGGAAAQYDIDGGPTYLTSPSFDLAGADASISYRYWLATANGVADQLIVQVSGDNQNWVQVAAHGSSNSEWAESFFTVSNYIVPTSTVRVRFVAADQPNDSVTDAGIDEFRVSQTICNQKNPCPADLDNDGTVGPADLAALLAVWGTNPKGAPDFDGNGVVDAADLASLLANWGSCNG